MRNKKLFIDEKVDESHTSLLQSSSLSADHHFQLHEQLRKFNSNFAAQTRMLELAQNRAIEGQESIKQIVDKMLFGMAQMQTRLEKLESKLETLVHQSSDCIQTKTFEQHHSRRVSELIQLQHETHSKLGQSELHRQELVRSNKSLTSDSAHNLCRY